MSGIAPSCDEAQKNTIITKRIKKMLDDSILNHSIFVDGLSNSEDSFYNIKQILLDAGVIFPAKMTWEPVKPLKVICYDEVEKLFYAHNEDEKFENLSDLYDTLDKTDVDVKFDESVRKSDQVAEFLGDDLSMIGVPSRQSGFRRMLMGRGRENQDTLDYSHYYHFLRLAKEWLENQNDFVLAYQFIQAHPAFWYRPSPERSPYMWSTDNGHESVWVGLSKNNGVPVVMLEHGASVEPEHRMHYHDFRLDVWAPTFEEAYIDLAKKTHKFFTLDGEERPDVDYQKTQLELELEERLEAAKKELDG